jgi:hypothetical protein
MHVKVMKVLGKVVRVLVKVVRVLAQAVIIGIHSTSRLFFANSVSIRQQIVSAL